MNVPRAVEQQMLKQRKLERWLIGLPVLHHAFVAVAAVIVLIVVNVIVDNNYAASNHPVSHAEGQTTFSGSEIKGFYAVMQDGGTLDRYVLAQIIDFGLIAAIILVGVTLGPSQSRPHHFVAVMRFWGRPCHERGP